MQNFTVSVLINRSQQDVFDFLCDPANLSKWDSDFESAEWTSSGVPDIGSTYRASGKRLGSEKDGFFEIVQWDRPNRYSYKVKERMFLFEHAETAITLTPKDNGTEATFESQFEIVGRLKFAEGLAARMGKKRIEGNLNAAKRLLEAGLTKRVLNSRSSAAFSSIFYTLAESCSQAESKPRAPAGNANHWGSS